VRLRDVQVGDVEAYVRMRCDPVMMAELGGPLPREGMESKVRRDVEDTASGRAWVCVIVPDETDPASVAGTVVVWSHKDKGAPMSEIGWMVLPEFQGRGLGKAAVRALLERARDEERWGIVHAFPAETNGASNGICRAVGFSLRGQQEVEFAGQMFTTNHWQINPLTDLTPPR
jgi:RimJ/RimL family protein N-acetyltransferase